MNYFLKSLCIFIFSKPILTFQSCPQSSKKFFTEPADITSYEGNWVDFTCSICSNLPFRYRIFWNIDPDIETRDQLHHDDAIGIITSTLTVQAIGRTDYFVSCNVRELSSADIVNELQNGRCFSTRRATLTVHYFPKKSELLCNPNKSHELWEGDVIDLKCRVTRCKPAVDLDWNLGDLNVTLPPVAKDAGRVRYLSYELIITQEMHLKTITCEVTSKLAFPGRSLDCPIGPLKVLQTPIVYVYPRHAILNGDQQVNISCEADGYPDVFEFIWTCLPDHLLNGCTTTDQTAVLSLNPNPGTDEQNYASVSCTALNAAGNATDSFNLTIDRKPRETQLKHTMETSTEGSCKTDSFLNITVYYVQRRNINYPITEINVLCLMSEAKSSSKVQWFIDRIPVNSTNEKFIVEKLWKSLYSLKIINPSQNDNGKEVACKVITCNTTKTASHILSLADDEKPLNLISESTASPSTATPSTASQHKELQSNHLLLWHMVTIVGVGVVLTIIITASLVTMIFICVYRRSGIVNNNGTNANTDDEHHQNVDQFIPSSDTHSSIDSTYEMPDVTIEPNSATLADSHSVGTIPHYHGYGLEHTYAPGDARVSCSSSQSSWSSISDTYDIESGYREDKITSQGNLETTFTSDAAYVNDIKRITVH